MSQDQFDKEVSSELWEDQEQAALDWLADSQAQAEYQDYLKYLETINERERNETH